MCKPILLKTILKQQADKVTCPIKINPTCHPKATLDVHVDGLGGYIYLSCSQCDRLVTKIKVPKYANLDTDPTP